MVESREKIGFSSKTMRKIDSKQKKIFWPKNLSFGP
jgi:hypothetical protein